MELYGNQEEHIIKLWLKRLAGVPTVLEIPSNNLRSHCLKVYRAQSTVELSVEAVNLLYRQSQALSLPPYSILLTAFGLILSRLTGESSFILGFALDGDTVPVRMDIDEDLNVQELLCNTHDSLEWSLENRGVSFNKIAEKLGVKQAGRDNPLVQAFFGVHGQGSSNQTGAQPFSFQTGEVDTSRPEFDIAMYLDNSSQSFSSYAVYATDLWDKDEARRFIADYSATVEQLLVSVAAGNSGKALVDIRGISANSMEVLETINKASHSFPDSSIDEIFRITAERWPEVEAVRDAGSVLTYSELAAAAAEQASLLLAAGVREGCNVALIQV